MLISTFLKPFETHRLTQTINTLLSLALTPSTTHTLRFDNYFTSGSFLSLIKLSASCEWSHLPWCIVNNRVFPIFPQSIDVSIQLSQRSFDCCVLGGHKPNLWMRTEKGQKNLNLPERNLKKNIQIRLKIVVQSLLARQNV